MPFANPYCVAGYGVLTQLGMPAGSTDYDWNGLHTERPIQMCRPNHYYNYIGIPVRWWGYNEAAGEINDSAQLAAWVTGNEPDLYSQDGLTIDQYVRMFRTYHSFIAPLDPTAKFAIAGITGGSTAERLAYTINWFTEALNKYRAAYGTAMPVDVWNVHSYCGPTQLDDPDRIISEFVNPFVNWCHTVENGAYAGREVWITELSIGEWMGAVSPENTIAFMQAFLPRLEQTGVTKWFWFVSRDSNEFAAVALVKNNAPTAVGQVYAALANSYPNTPQPIVPFVPDPAPSYVFFDFSGPFAAPWFNKGGNWGVDRDSQPAWYYSEWREISTPQSTPPAAPLPSSFSICSKTPSDGTSTASTTLQSPRFEGSRARTGSRGNLWYAAGALARTGTGRSAQTTVPAASLSAF